MNVAVVGASNKPDRYSYKAVKSLSAKGHRVFPVHPRIKDIDGLAVYASLGLIEEKLDTLTMYVGAETSARMSGEILSARPRRIIFNPGAENHELFKKAEEAGIEVIDACTLVMLSTGQF